MPPSDRCTEGGAGRRAAGGRRPADGGNPGRSTGFPAPEPRTAPRTGPDTPKWRLSVFGPESRRAEQILPKIGIIGAVGARVRRVRFRRERQAAPRAEPAPRWLPRTSSLLRFSRCRTDERHLGRTPGTPCPRPHRRSSYPARPRLPVPGATRGGAALSTPTGAARLHAATVKGAAAAATLFARFVSTSSRNDSRGSGSMPASR